MSDVISYGAEDGTGLQPHAESLAHGLWMRRFGADASIIGRRIVLNGVPHEVVGVMPTSFEHPADAELWLPLAPVGQFQALFGARGSYWLTIVGRLKPGVTRVAAQSGQIAGPFAQVPHGRYINFISDFIAAEPSATRERAIRAWTRLKALDVPKDYRSWKRFRSSKAKQ